MGGRIAIDFALNYPDKLKILTVLDSALDGYASTVDWDVKAKEEGIEKAKQNWLNHQVFEPTRKNQKVTKFLSQIVDDYSGWHWLNSKPDRESTEKAINRLEQINVPTLIIVGKEDLQYFHDIADILEAKIPNATRIDMPGVGHMVNLEAADRLNKLLQNQFQAIAAKNS